MKNTFFIMLIMLSFSSMVHAHSKVNETHPENGKILTEIPKTIEMDFEKKIRLTKVILEVGDEDPIQFDLSEYKGFTRNFIFPIETRGKGLYSVNWRGLGTDGHPMKGNFSFMVK